MEKEKVKKRAKRYSSYGHIRGEYTTLNNTHLPHVKRDGKDTLTNTNYYHHFCESSVIRTNLHKNKLFLSACNWQLPTQGGTCTNALLLRISKDNRNWSKSTNGRVEATEEATQGRVQVQLTPTCYSQRRPTSPVRSALRILTVNIVVF